VLLWGGRSSDRWERDGALYDPGSDEWRILPPGPVADSAEAKALWTGDELVVLGGEPVGHRSMDVAAAYSPAEDAWRALPSAPDGDSHWSAAGASDRWVLVPGRRLEHGVVTPIASLLDVRDGRWRVASMPPLHLDQPWAQVATLGARFVVLGAAPLAETDGFAPALSVYDPGSDAWSGPSMLPWGVGGTTHHLTLAAGAGGGIVRSSPVRS
jgi:hypothetical protein